MFFKSICKPIPVFLLVLSIAARAQDPVDTSYLNNPYYKAMMNGQPVPQTPARANAGKRKTFPKPKPGFMASLPVLSSDSEVAQYVKRLQQMLMMKTPAGKMASAKKVQADSKGNAQKLSAAAVAAWQSGADHEAILLATEASVQQPGNPLVLNNLSALLNLAGSEEKSLPILRKLAKEHPQSSMVLNNLGQAYAGAGELDKAMESFARCLKVEPNHPEANNTAAQIEMSRGNMEKAMQYFQWSSRKVVTNATLQEMERDATANWINMRAKVRLPYFNPYADKYKLPPQILSANTADQLWTEHAEYETMLDRTIDMYQELINYEGEQSRLSQQKKAQTAIANAQKGNIQESFNFSPFAAQASRKLSVLMQSYAHRQIQLARDVQEREQDIEKLRKKYQAKLAEIAESCDGDEKCYCAKANAAADEFLSAAAPIRRDIQEKQLILARQRFENRAYYGYLGGVDKHDSRRRFFEACAEYLRALAEANKTAYEQKNCAYGEMPGEKTLPLDAPIDFDCPIQLTIDIKIGELELNCEKFKISAFGGILKGSRDAKSKQYTLALGADIGKGIDIKNLGIAEGSVELTLEETFYITFDEHHQFVDGGLAMELEASAEIGSSIMDGMNGVKKWETSLGYTLGVNSGWTFSDGALGSVGKALAAVMR